MECNRTEDGGQMLEVRGRRTEDRCQRTDVRGQKTAVGVDLNVDVAMRKKTKLEFGMRNESEIGIWEPGIKA